VSSDRQKNLFWHLRHFCGILNIYYDDRAAAVTMELGTDEELAQQFASVGDGRALEVLFRRHMDPIYRLARRYFVVHEDAEEIVSESFLRCFRALREGQFRGESLFKTWLVRIAVNVCLERLRQPRLPTLIFETLTDTAAPESLPGSLNSALKHLPDDQRLALVLCDLEGYDAKEAAAIIGRSVTATKSLHYRARRSLRDILLREKNELDGV
jgi:RNA polymerase sigma-70 factor (ECF subfamily)